METPPETLTAARLYLPKVWAHAPTPKMAGIFLHRREQTAKQVRDLLQAAGQNNSRIINRRLGINHD